MPILNFSKETRQAFKVNTKKKVYREIKAPYAGCEYQVDLMEVGASFGNSKVKYLLCVVDVFSRKAGVIGLTSKRPTNAIEGFKNILKMYFDDWLPNSIQTDDGSEWKGVFSKWLEDNEIERYIVVSKNEHNKQGIVERFNGTLGRLIEMWKYENGERWYKDLGLLIKAYNNHKHSRIQQTPNDVWDGVELPSIKRDKEEKGIKKFENGDSVRIKLKRGTFAKGKKQRYSTMIFKVVGKEGERYIVEDEDGETQKVLYSNLLKV